MLTCKNLKLAQGDFRLAADVSFAKGTVTAVIGPSGAGKSTLLSAIAGFIVPASGDIALDGVSFSDAAPGARPVSVLFQDNNLFPHLTIRENVSLGLRNRAKLRDAQQRAVSDVLGQVGLPSEYIDRKPSALSGGQQSRAALARVLLSEQPIVLLDEPFAALGPGLKDEMLELMRATLLHDKGRTVLMVSHDPADARQVADAVTWVANGIVNPPRFTANIFANPPDGMRTYLGATG